MDTRFYGKTTREIAASIVAFIVETYGEMGQIEEQLLERTQYYINVMERSDITFDSVHALAERYFWECLTQHHNYIYATEENDRCDEYIRERLPRQGGKDVFDSVVELATQYFRQ